MSRRARNRERQARAGIASRRVCRHTDDIFRDLEIPAGLRKTTQVVVCQRNLIFPWRFGTPIDVLAAGLLSRVRDSSVRILARRQGQTPAEPPTALIIRSHWESLEN